ncbi:Deuterolysin metalloprotease family-domain-containing protein [Lineolata rhizophorae]|uniref:Neutral protease 2 n=1 Tax=Lineolata rhizophorae TaxID=578093 RepID=A0A6A6PFF3_9PEZI|nr:Deuterolysin metalloprotease family-domain-containing protein [Lineolata rhizophorae]
MKFLTHLAWATFASLANCHSIGHLNKRDTPLSIELQMEGNTMVKAFLTNTGDVGLNLLKKGTILDDSAPVEKVEVNSPSARIPFNGIRLRLLTDGLAEDAFQFVDAGETIEFDFDIASLHDLSSGGAFSLRSYGAIPYAEAGSTSLSGLALDFDSNVLDIEVDGLEASRVPRALQGRAVLARDCTGSLGNTMRSSFDICSQMADYASEQATSGSADKFEEYFKTTNSRTRQVVADRLSAVSEECSSYVSGNTEYHCTDSYQACQSNVLAYTVPSLDYIVSCPLFFDALPLQSTQCHGQDQATTVLHEMTHAPGVYSPGTDDNAYGYDAAMRLNSRDAVLNADTYALYANALDLGC